MFIPMCNHYRQAILKGAKIPGWSIDQFSDIKIPLRFDNLPEHVYPDGIGLVIRAGEDDRWEPETMRWGFPPPPRAGSYYITNVRNTTSAYWRPWLAPEYRCLVPVTAFAEYDQNTPPGKKVERWFARPNGEAFFFAGIWRPFAGTRGTKKDPVVGEHLVYSFLTTDANEVVKPIHAKAMPVLLSLDEADYWLRAPVEEALKLQKPAAPDAVVLLELA
jgi:putative SOS response-associated peptidase YedK